MEKIKFAQIDQAPMGNVFYKQKIECKRDTDRESMSHMHTKLNSNAHWHNKVNNRDCIQLYIQNCHYTLYSVVLLAMQKENNKLIKQ